MKGALVLVGLSVAVMAVMIFQAVRQELNLRDLKARMAHNAAEVKKKEEAILEVKNKIEELKATLSSVNGDMDELKKKKADSVKAAEEFEKSRQACEAEKENAAKKKTGMTEALDKLKADHTEAKKKAEEEVKNLKQQILDRDKAICALVDTANEEARKLCGIEAPK